MHAFLHHDGSITLADLHITPGARLDYLPASPQREPPSPCFRLTHKDGRTEHLRLEPLPAAPQPDAPQSAAP